MGQSKPTRYKGKVGVSVSKGVLRISLPRALYNGKQKYLSTGLKDTPENRKIAEARAKQIEVDILLGRFDFSLERYKPQKASLSKKTKSLTLIELYQRYIKVKKPTVRPWTYRGGYQVMLNHLKSSPYRDVIPDSDTTGFAQGLADWANAHLSADGARRLLVQLNACLDWAIASRLTTLTESPFKGMARKAVKRKGPRGERNIEPFTLEQRNAIIEHYRCHPKYSHYYLFVAFCFYVGCRPSEARALEREDISEDLKQVTFSHAVVMGEKGQSRLKGLKTQDRRTIYCSESARRILAEAIERSPNKIVFPGARGGLMGDKPFRNSWKAVLGELGIEYRKPYQMRHTFITLCLEAGVKVKDVAKIVGNSPEIIYRHYAENQSQVVIPDL